MKKVLFLCTGNYYRSRYAEILFAHHAKFNELSWHSDSRGIAVELGAGNIGPISVHSLQNLTRKGIQTDEKDLRFPIQLLEKDLQSANLTIALYEPEHRPLLQERFPNWENSVSYWYAPDLQHRKMSVEDTLAYIEAQILQLINLLL